MHLIYFNLTKDATERQKSYSGLIISTWNTLVCWCGVFTVDFEHVSLLVKIRYIMARKIKLNSINTFAMYFTALRGQTEYFTFPLIIWTSIPSA